MVSWSDGSPIDWLDGELDIGQAGSSSISHAMDGVIGLSVGQLVDWSANKPLVVWLVSQMVGQSVIQLVG